MSNTIEIKKENVLIIFFEANSFMDAYTTKKCSLGKSPNEIGQPCCIVLLSFACELYLKLLYCLEKIENDNSIEDIKMEKEHKLDVLFERLSSNLKKMIAEKAKISVDEILTKLDKHKNDFIEWRYIFEKDENNFDCSIQFLEYIVGIIYEISKHKVEKIDFNSKSTSFEINF